MTNLQKRLQREIASFIEAIQSGGSSIPDVSKAVFCKAQKELKPKAFQKLSKIVLQDFYESDEVEHCNASRLIGC